MIERSFAISSRYLKITSSFFDRESRAFDKSDKDPVVNWEITSYGLPMALKDTYGVAAVFV
jgi:hypothetical protein